MLVGNYVSWRLRNLTTKRRDKKKLLLLGVRLRGDLLFIRSVVHGDLLFMNHRLWILLSSSSISDVVVVVAPLLVSRRSVRVPMPGGGGCPSST